MTAVEWTVGQEVIVRSPNYARGYSDTPATITRVARKYVYIAGRYGREQAFDIETGVERTGPNDNGHYAARVFTAESLAEHDRHQDVVKRLNEATRGYGWTNRLSTDDAEAILRIIEAGAS